METINEIIDAVNSGSLSIDQAVDAALAGEMEYALECFSPNTTQLAFWDIRENWKARARDEAAPRLTPVVDSRPVLRCKSCGQIGHAGEYPFSTLPGSGRCDDCV